MCVPGQGPSGSVLMGLAVSLFGVLGLAEREAEVLRRGCPD